MGFIDLLTRYSPIPCAGKPFAHLGQAAYIDLNFMRLAH